MHAYLSYPFFIVFVGNGSATNNGVKGKSALHFTKITPSRIALTGSSEAFMDTLSK